MKRARMLSSVAVAILIGIGCGSGKPQDASATTPSNDTPAETQPVAGGGSASIRGTVKLSGTAPTMGKIKMDADPVCQQQHSSPVYTEDVVVNGQGMLKNVFVYVKEGAPSSATTPTTPVTLNQSGCWYAPHIFGIQTNQPLEIVNSDATLHNINAKPTVNQPFNIAQPVKGMKTDKKFAKPEIMVTFKCNVHPWMHAYAGVLDHPFFNVSDADGSFTIGGLPAGTYVVEAWHEKYGAQTQKVIVADGESKAVEFTFNAQ